MDFSESKVWGFFCLIAVLLVALLVANMLKRKIPFIRKSLIPTSVLAGIIILVVSSIYTIATKGDYLFELGFFGSPAENEQDLSLSGLELLEIVTYHCLALGFIATAFKPAQQKLSKKRSVEVFNSGVTTVSTYLMQAILGMSITVLACVLFPAIMKIGDGPGLIHYAGIILCFGYGQGTGQALNYGKIYQNINKGIAPTDEKYIDNIIGTLGNGSDFGLSIASLGFISAAIGGVIYLIIARRRREKALKDSDLGETMTIEKVQSSDELPMESSGVDKITLQFALVLGSYFIAYGIIYLLGLIIPGMKDTIYGFNFLIGVLVATIVCALLRFFRKKNIIKHEFVNPFLMKRIAGFFFDIMIIAGMAAIKPDTLGKYWHVLLIMGVVGAVSTFFYLKFVADKLFPEYKDEQFLATYGMLTGTASSGMVLLREWDPKFKTPAADNLVFQNFPAIAFGFPLLLLAAPKMIAVHPYLVYGILVAFFVVLNIILFRSFIFKKRKKKTPTSMGDEINTGELDLGEIKEE